MNWREPATEAFSCVANPSDRSCDNGVLFTAEALALGIITRDDFESVLTHYRDLDGWLLRYPGVIDYCSYDDYIGAAAMSQSFARDALTLFRRTEWETPARDWLARFPLLIPTIRAGAGETLPLHLQAWAAIAYVSTMLEPRTETSGKLLCFMAAFALEGKGAFIGAVIRAWRRWIDKQYSGIGGVLSIYFPPGHPFIDRVVMAQVDAREVW